MRQCLRNCVAWPRTQRETTVIRKLFLTPSTRSFARAVLLVCTAFFFLPAVSAQPPIPARHLEGTVHGFLVVHTLEGKQIATGELTQTIHGDRVSSRIVYRFKNGSLDDDIAEFSQRGVFRLIRDHHLQKGPSFPHPSDVSIETATGQITVHSWDGGKEKIATDHVDMPPDLANGLILTIMKNVAPNVPGTKVSLLATTPKPRLVKLALSPLGEERFSAAGARHSAMHFVVKVELGGIVGVVAPLIGKQPENTQVWVVGGSAPAFAKSEGPFYEGGPIWRTELTSPVWPAASGTAAVK